MSVNQINRALPCINKMSKTMVTKTRLVQICNTCNESIQYQRSRNGTERTEYTLHELVFGKSARVPISSILPDYKNNESYPEYATTLFKRIFDAQILARKNVEHTKIRCKRYYDRNANPQACNKDDYILKEVLRNKFDEQGPKE